MAGTVGIGTRAVGAGLGLGVTLGEGLGVALGEGLGLGVALGLGEGVETVVVPVPPVPDEPPLEEQTFWLGDTNTVNVPTEVGAVKVKVEEPASQVGVKPPLLFKVILSVEVKVMLELPEPSFSKTTVIAVVSTIMELTAELTETCKVLSNPDK